IRKSLCMFGWDWGPMLPDMGIWRGITMEAYDSARIADVEIRQRHSGNEVWLLVNPQIQECGPAVTSCRARLISPDGKEELFALESGKDNVIKITDRQLWWPNGMGEQPLYTLETELWTDGEKSDSLTRQIGLRTLKLSREKDIYGSEFCFEINGKKIFAKGANCIPEDSIFPRMNNDRTLRLLEDCAKANFNCLRVWGGGFYPDEYFYSQCDRLGIIVWQDFMFACMNVYLSEDFRENVCCEIADVLIRLRQHPSLGVLCGNNEIEEALTEWGSCLGHSTDENRKDYLELFEKIIPDICGKLAPDISYISSTPSSFGHFEDPRNECFGDTHTWAVWQKGQPVEEYGNIRSRFCSEFGFSAFPSIHTINSFATPEEQYIDSETINAHQKCSIAHKNIVSCLKEEYGTPDSFPLLVYGSQLVQADAIRMAVEHFRQNSDYCKGALYWQLNDCWPTISWSSIDYYGRWKALQWKAMKFFAPIMISVSSAAGLALNVSNEALGTFAGRIVYDVCDNSFDVLASGRIDISVGELSNRNFEITKNVSACLLENPCERFLRYRLVSDGGNNVVSKGTYIHCKPSEYKFRAPHWNVKASVNGNCGRIVIGAESYQRDVALFFADPKINVGLQFFDMDSAESIEIPLNNIPLGISADDIERQLSVLSCYDLVNKGGNL
ncbi:MAG: glycoside hydrolase family 2 protein, partial [Eubacteriales bacterium]